MNRKEIILITVTTSISILLAMFFEYSLLEYAWILFIAYLLIGLWVALVWWLERHLHNKKRWFILETYKELCIVLCISILIRPIVLSAYKK